MRDRYLLIFLMLLGVASRAGAVLALQSHRVLRSTYEHGEIAANLLAGRGFSVTFLGAVGPTSQQAPFYPALVALAYAAGGIGTPRALLILELGQAVLGAWLVLGTWRLARAVAPARRWAAPLAGLVVAVHPTLVYAATHVQVATLATTLLVWTLASAYEIGLRRHQTLTPALSRGEREEFGPPLPPGEGRGEGLPLRQPITTGLLLAALTLTDPILALVAPGLAWAVVARRGWRGAWRPLAIVALTAALGVAPWIARNHRVHGELVFVKSTFGYAFWQGNCALSEGTDKVVRRSVERALEDSRPGLGGWNAALWAARHEAGYIDDIALSREDYRQLGRLSEPARSRLLCRRALADLRADPWRYPALCLRRLRYFLLFDETNPKARSPLYRASHLALNALAILGVLVAGRAARRRLAPTFLTVMLITLFHSLTIVSARFHLPIEPLLGLWGAVGLAGLSSASAADDVEGVGVGHGLLRGGVSPPA